MQSNTVIRRGTLTLVASATMLVALAGGATAGKLITGSDIKDGSVTGVDIMNSSITGSDIKNGSLTAGDFKGKIVGAPGPQGPVGPQGPKGTDGSTGVSGLEYITIEQSVGGKKSATWAAECSTNQKKVVGGGVSSNDPSSMRVIESAPLDNGRGWWVGLRNESSNSVGAYAWAICVFA